MPSVPPSGVAEYIWYVMFGEVEVGTLNVSWWKTKIESSIVGIFRPAAVNDTSEFSANWTACTETVVESVSMPFTSDAVNVN